YNLTDTNSLIGWAAAGALSRVANLAALTPLLASPVARLGSRGLAARALAGMFSYGVEGAAFPLATRLASEGLGVKSDWSDKSLGEAFTSSYFFLGGLRLGGLGAGTLGSLLGVRKIFAETLLSQIGMLGGVHLGHELHHFINPAIAALPL